MFLLCAQKFEVGGEHSFVIDRFRQTIRFEGFGGMPLGKVRFGKGGRVLVLGITKSEAELLICKGLLEPVTYQEVQSILYECSKK